MGMNLSLNLERKDKLDKEVRVDVGHPRHSSQPK